jgi:alpha,alpha-trehalose phosphorylase
MALVTNGIHAAIFDMDGVVTQTSHLHAMAWKKAFDNFLAAHASNSLPYPPFDTVTEYHAYVDGKPRLEGVRSFLHARNIIVNKDEEEELARQKEEFFNALLLQEGIQTYPATIALLQTLRAHGVKTAVVTSSRHGREILQHAGISSLFDARFDGIDLEDQRLAGKPAPDMFLRAAQSLGVAPRQVMAIEDAVTGVQAAHQGKFGLVVGIDRGGNAKALSEAGADMVVSDLAETSLDELNAAWHARREKIAWHIEQEGFDRARERQMESLFSIGNGYMGVRGALDLLAPGSQGDLFIAGIYDQKSETLPYSEIEFLTPERGPDPFAELVPFPFPLYLKLLVDETSVDSPERYGNDFRRLLDMRCGVLHSQTVYEASASRRITLRTRRCTSLADRHLLLQEGVVDSECVAEKIRLDVSLEQADLHTLYPHLILVEHTATPDQQLLHYMTRVSELHVCIASRVIREQNVLRRFIVVYTSRDGAEPHAAALAHLKALDGADFEALLAAHTAMWQQFWLAADIRIEGRPTIEQALRFGSYHLKIAAPVDPRISIGARALTGRAYEGHIFWDNEIFMLPFFLHVEPAVARNLLLYRHHTLPGAKRRAHELGCRGACYAWESTVTGDDVTPSTIRLKSSGKKIPIFTGKQQLHVTADVAYGVWRYWEATGDDEFLFGPGTEILFETARFWASKVVSGAQHMHIRGVIGPDEYHHAVNDNAYTNWMARFNLERAAWVATTLGIDQAEAAEWSGLAKSLYIPGPNEQGIIEQFEGFFSLGDYAVSKEERFKTPVSRLFDWQAINGLKVIKQADVLMLPLLFPDAFSDEVVKANYQYYEPITDHGSSLSPAVHAAIAARLGMREEAEWYWEQSLWLDLSNAMNNSTLGIHVAALGGTWQALVFGFLGVRFGEGSPYVSMPAGARTPAGGSEVELTVAYRGRTYPLNAMWQKEARSVYEPLYVTASAS